MGVKVVELKKENNLPVLVNYAISGDSGSLLQSDGLEVLDGQVEGVISGTLKSGKFSTKRSVIGIPSFLSLISFIELPEMPDSEIEQAVKFEAAKYIPTPLDEVSLGWEVVGSFQNNSLEGRQSVNRGRKLQIMIVSVPKITVERYGKIAKETGLESVAMEVSNFAAVRCLIGNDKGTFMIVDIGAKSTDLTVVSDGVLRVTRSIDVGGSEISRSLASGLGIDFKRADKLKKSSRINLLNSRDEISRLIAPSIGLITVEIKRLIEIYHKKNPLKKVEALVFTGGSSKMSTLIDLFSKELSIECRLGNPLARIAYDEKYKDVLTDTASELAVGIGLAMRGLEDK